MKTVVIIVLALCVNAQLNGLHQEEKKQQSSGEISRLHQINDNLYTGKVADKFYLAMERVTPKNITFWLDYAGRQQRTAGRILSSNPYLPTSDGINAFLEVLQEYKAGKLGKESELWIDYASTEPVTDYLQNAKSYEHIDMFVTVITSQDALITSHMGISRSAEAAIALNDASSGRIKHPDQSVHLHSFAAKVMKARDPKKTYMLTAPVPAMRTILIKKMPHNSVFIGDDNYKKLIEAAEKDPHSLLVKSDLKEKQNESTQERDDRLKRRAESKYKDFGIKEKFELLKTNPPRILRTNTEDLKGFIILNPEGSAPLVNFNENTTIYNWLFNPAYMLGGIIIPYALLDIDKLAKATSLQKI